MKKLAFVLAALAILAIGAVGYGLAVGTTQPAQACDHGNC
jgi:hypothetical protein